MYVSLNRSNADPPSPAFRSLNLCPPRLTRATPLHYIRQSWPSRLQLSISRHTDSNTSCSRVGPCRIHVARGACRPPCAVARGCGPWRHLIDGTDGGRPDSLTASYVVVVAHSFLWLWPVASRINWFVVAHYACTVALQLCDEWKYP